MNSDAAGRLSPRAAAGIARASTGTVVTIALAAAVLSYSGLHGLAVESGVSGTLAWLLPVCVDGLVIAASLGVLHATLTGTGAAFSWLLVGLGVAASTGGNVLVAHPSVTARLVAGAPPVILALALEQALRVLRHRAGLPARRVVRKTSTATTLTAALVGVSGDSAAQGPSTPARTGTTSRQPRAARTGSKTAAARALLAGAPDMPIADVVATTGVDPADARRIRRALLAETTGSATSPVPAVA
ncbi:uncharacterized protein DUF2637 [Oryzihumus leptocrescens]|uniref:Uncharacterized protein DUF2637 n=2 Tax=Oryzihumus leptocrescens TaxID=297536 RepID=A0A542ZEJ5_9MICO|nr:DUF2637 domain-containing protein [Oryzihumus leptocrescens]TQL58763.1 uncharacterized protein DUF2637 [Oryzihumus leptocrescens]